MYTHDTRDDMIAINMAHMFNYSNQFQHGRDVWHKSAAKITGQEQYVHTNDPWQMWSASQIPATQEPR